MRQSEATLDEMLADPIVRLLMRRDGVKESEIRSLMNRLRIPTMPPTYSEMIAPTIPR